KLAACSPDEIYDHGPRQTELREIAQRLPLPDHWLFPYFDRLTGSATSQTVDRSILAASLLLWLYPPTSPTARKLESPHTSDDRLFLTTRTSDQLALDALYSITNHHLITATPTMPDSPFAIPSLDVAAFRAALLEQPAPPATLAAYDDFALT